MLVTSQKTLSVAALLIPQLSSGSASLRPSAGGYALLVCVFVYVLQLAMDFTIGSYWAL